MNDTQLLPDDLAVCQALIIEQRQKISEQDHTLVEQARAITELHGKVEEQKLTINELMQRAFRNRSERYVQDPNQLKLDFGNTPEAADAAEAVAAPLKAEADKTRAAYTAALKVADDKRALSEQAKTELYRLVAARQVTNRPANCASPIASVNPWSENRPTPFMPPTQSW